MTKVAMIFEKEKEEAVNEERKKWQQVIKEEKQKGQQAVEQWFHLVTSVSRVYRTQYKNSDRTGRTMRGWPNRWIHVLQVFL